MNPGSISSPCGSHHQRQQRGNNKMDLERPDRCLYMSVYAKSTIQRKHSHGSVPKEHREKAKQERRDEEQEPILQRRIKITRNNRKLLAQFLRLGYQSARLNRLSVCLSVCLDVWMSVYMSCVRVSGC